MQRQLISAGGAVLCTEVDYILLFQRNFNLSRVCGSGHCFGLHFSSTAGVPIVEQKVQKRLYTIRPIYMSISIYCFHNSLSPVSLFSSFHFFLETNNKTFPFPYTIIICKSDFLTNIFTLQLSFNNKCNQML